MVQSFVKWYQLPNHDDGAGWHHLWNGFSPSEEPLPFYLPNMQNDTALYRDGDSFYMGASTSPIGTIIRSAPDLERALTDERDPDAPLTLWIDAALLPAALPGPHPRVTALVIRDSFGAVNLETLEAFPELQALQLSTGIPLDFRVLCSCRTLKSLVIRNCSLISHLACAATLPALIHLDIETSRAKLSTFPHLPGLKSLTLPWSLEDFDLDMVLKQTPALESLTCNNSPSLSQISLHASPTLRRFVARCSGLIDLASLSRCMAIDTLEVPGSKKLSDVSTLALLKNLKRLDLTECPNIADDWVDVLASRHISAAGVPPNVSDGHLSRFVAKAPHLTHLALRDCDRLTNLEPIGSLTHLSSLEVLFCDGLSNLDFVSKVPHLQRLDIRLQGRVDLSPVKTLSGLKYLGLDYAEGIVDTAFLSSMRQLLVLDLSFSDIVALTRFESLQSASAINLRGCDGITDFGPLSALKSLVWLEISSTSITTLWDIGANRNLVVLRMADVDLPLLTGIEACQSLREIDFSGSRIESVNALSRLPNLRDLRLDGCVSAAQIETLCNAKQLARLEAGHEHFGDLTLLSQLVSLNFLDLTIDANVETLSGIERLTNLRECRLHGGANVVDVTALRHCHEAVVLQLEAFERLSDIGPLSEMNKMRVVECESCGLQDLTPLAKCQDLVKVDLNMCDKLVRVHPLTGLARLSQVELSQCSRVHDPEVLTDVVRRGGRVVLPSGEELISGGRRAKQ